MVEAGVDGLDFDTAGASGDADLLATLRVARRLRDAYPDVGIEIGQASELVLGMHGQLEYEGTRLAGQWPLGQLRACEAAGATIFGPAVNVDTTKSLAWNTARACALIKPVHRRGHHPRARERGDGRRRRAHDPVSARRRDVPGLQSPRRHLQDRRVVGGGRGSPRDGLVTRARLGHGRDADRRRSGGSHATDPGPAPSAGQAVRRRQARLFRSLDLSDTIAMHDLRRDLGLARMQVQDLTYADHPGTMEAKFHIAEVLDIPINSVERFKANAGLGVTYDLSARSQPAAAAAAARLGLHRALLRRREARPLQGGRPAGARAHRGQVRLAQGARHPGRARRRRWTARPASCASRPTS